MSATLTSSERYWLGRLSMALALTDRYPEASRQALREYIRSSVITAEQRDRLREELADGARHHRRK